MNFGEAIILVMKGYRMMRAGWNGKDQYIELVLDVSGYTDADGECVFCNKAIGFKGTSGYQMGWLASQGDMLADDWEVYNG